MFVSLVGFSRVAGLENEGCYSAGDVLVVVGDMRTKPLSPSPPVTFPAVPDDQHPRVEWVYTVHDLPWRTPRRLPHITNLNVEQRTVE